jgi:hypothetical protein
VKRSETRADDQARTERLLDASDVAFEREPVDGLAVEFKAVDIYPPAGHGFPRRG